MKIFSIDTSSKIFSLAVCEGERVLAKSSFRNKKTLSSSIISKIDRILSRSGVTLKNLDCIVVGLGPGSFTSLRVGLATVKGLAFAAKKKIIGIPSLDVIAMNVKDQGKQICVISDAKRNLVFYCLYKKNNGRLKRLSKHSLCELKDVFDMIKEPTIFVGDAISLYKDKLNANKNVLISENEKNWFPKAENLAKLALERYKNKRIEDINKIVPLYLYPKDCQVKSVKRYT